MVVEEKANRWQTHLVRPCSLLNWELYINQKWMYNDSILSSFSLVVLKHSCQTVSVYTWQLHTSLVSYIVHSHSSCEANLLYFITSNYLHICSSWIYMYYHTEIDFTWDLVITEYTNGKSHIPCSCRGAGMFFILIQALVMSKEWIWKFN